MQLILPATGVLATLMSVILRTAVDVAAVNEVAEVRCAVISAVACQGREAVDAFGEPQQGSISTDYNDTV